jgi:serine/threonine-protein kinase
MECLAKDPEQRPQSARELAERFDTALDRAQAKIDSDPVRPGLGSGSRPGLPAVKTDETGGMAAGTTTVQSRLSRDQAVLPFSMEAWMPEKIAIMKLRGFVHDAGGEVVESLPGLIRVRLGVRQDQSGAGPLAWLGLRKSSSLVDVELHLKHNDPTQPNQLTVDVLFRPSHASQLNDRAWRERCASVFVEVRSYLMGRSEN